MKSGGLEIMYRKNCIIEFIDCFIKNLKQINTETINDLYQLCIELMNSYIFHKSHRGWNIDLDFFNMNRENIKHDILNDFFIRSSHKFCGNSSFNKIFTPSGEQSISDDQIRLFYKHINEFVKNKPELLEILQDKKILIYNPESKYKKYLFNPAWDSEIYFLVETYFGKEKFLYDSKFFHNPLDKVGFNKNLEFLKNFQANTRHNTLFHYYFEKNYHLSLFLYMIENCFSYETTQQPLERKLSPDDLLVHTCNYLSFAIFSLFEPQPSVAIKLNTFLNYKPQNIALIDMLFPFILIEKIFSYGLEMLLEKADFNDYKHYFPDYYFENQDSCFLYDDYNSSYFNYYEFCNKQNNENNYIFTPTEILSCILETSELLYKDYNFLFDLISRDNYKNLVLDNNYFNYLYAMLSDMQDKVFLKSAGYCAHLKNKFIYS